MRHLNGLKVNTYGNEDNPPVIFLHGFVYDSSMWAKQIEALQEDYYCVTFDFRGMGASVTGDGLYTMEMFADDIFYIIEELQLEKPVLCGLSMGGYAAFTALLMKPDIFGAVIILDSRAAADNNAAKEKRANTIKRINSEGMEPFLEEFIPLCFGDKFKKEQPVEFSGYIERAKSFQTLGVKGCTTAMKGRPDATGILGSLRMPVMVLCGENDILTPPEEMKEMADAIPNAEFHIIPRSGHMTPIENPDKVNAYIVRFLTKTT